MKSSAVLLALPTLGATLNERDFAAADIIKLAVRQQATTTAPPTSGPEFTTACASSYTSFVNRAISLNPPYPTELESFWSSLALTTDLVCAQGTATLPPRLSSLESEWLSSVLRSQSEGVTWLAPYQCSAAWESIVESSMAMERSAQKSCSSAAARAHNATATPTVGSSPVNTMGTTTAAVPTNTSGAGRNTISF
ncbi:hypothetical protein PspLS_12129 [Pyricularia sp. CBS 133598]|nr:hypothetical protein PspLS_12129 [Pyricularia sp. CBS 133598]